MVKHAPRFLKLVEASQSRIREVTIYDVELRLGEKPQFHLVDVREDHEWDAGHLPGAIHLGKGIIERDIEKTISDPTTAITLYCGGGYRSVLAADSLQQMGYTNVSSMDGGYRAWCEAGFNVI